MNVKDLQKRMDEFKKAIDPKRRQQEKSIERKKGLMKGLALGTFIGGLVGIFYAPDKGENTRKKAKKELEKAKDVIENSIAEGKVKFDEFYEEKKDIINEKMVVFKERIKANEDAAITEEVFEEEEN